MIQQTINKTRLLIASFAAGLLTIVGSMGAVVVQPSIVSAADPCKPASIVAFPRWYDNGLCEASGDTAKIKSPNAVGGIAKFFTIIAMNIVTIILMVVGYVSLAFIIWGGFKYMYSGDNANGTAAARKTILNAVIGLILSIMSVAIVKVISGAIG